MRTGFTARGVLISAHAFDGQARCGAVRYEPAVELAVGGLGSAGRLPGVSAIAAPRAVSSLTRLVTLIRRSRRLRARDAASLAVAADRHAVGVDADNRRLELNLDAELL